MHVYAQAHLPSQGNLDQHFLHASTKLQGELVSPHLKSLFPNLSNANKGGYAVLNQQLPLVILISGGPVLLAQS